MVKALQYKLRMFRVPNERPLDMICDNREVYKNYVIP